MIHTDGVPTIAMRSGCPGVAVPVPMVTRVAENPPAALIEEILYEAARGDYGPEDRAIVRNLAAVTPPDVDKEVSNMRIFERYVRWQDGFNWQGAA